MFIYSFMPLYYSNVLFGGEHKEKEEKKKRLINNTDPKVGYSAVFTSVTLLSRQGTRPERRTVSI